MTHDRISPRTTMLGLLFSLAAHALFLLLLGVAPAHVGAMVTSGPESEATFDEVPALVTLDLPDPAPPRQDPAVAETLPPQPSPPDQKLAEAPPPPPAPNEPPQVRLGSPTSKSETVTQTWIGFDEFMAHAGAPSIVDQPQLTRDAPGPSGMKSAPVATSQSLGAVANSSAPPEPTKGPEDASPPMEAAAPPTIPNPIVISPRASAPPPQGQATTPASPDGAPPDNPAPTQATKQTRPTPPPTDHSPTPVDPPQSNTPAPTGESAPRVPEAVPTPAKAVAAEDKKEIAAPAGNSSEQTVAPQQGRPGSPDGKDEPQLESTARAQTPSPPAPAQQQQSPAPPAVTTGAESKAHADSSSQSKEMEHPSDAPPGVTPGPVPTGPSTRPAVNQAFMAPRPASRPAPQAGGSGQNAVGILSDRESVAAAIKSALDVTEFGKPLVAKGLKIRTVRPKLTKYTEITSRGAPVIRILFNRMGEAADVQVLKSSGNPDIDRPVVDAAYEWTAEGKELEQLSEKPPGTVAVDVRIIR